MLVVLAVNLMPLVMEMSIITKKFVVTIDRYIRTPFLKVVIVNEIKQPTKLKALDCTIKSCGKVRSALFLAAGQPGAWI